MDQLLFLRPDRRVSNCYRHGNGQYCRLLRPAGFQHEQYFHLPERRYFNFYFPECLAYGNCAAENPTALWLCDDGARRGRAYAQSQSGAVFRLHVRTGSGERHYHVYRHVPCHSTVRRASTRFASAVYRLLFQHGGYDFPDAGCLAAGTEY